MPSFLANISYQFFKSASRALRRTPLRRMKWLTATHSRLFRAMRPAGPVAVGGFRMHLDPRDAVLAKKLALYGAFEPVETSVLVKLATPGATVIDIGANIGLHTVQLSRAVGAGGKVFAFEPDPEAFALLQRNLRENGCTNVDAFPLAVSNTDGQVELHRDHTNPLASSLRALPGQTDTVSVRTVQLDEFFAGRRARIALVKLDVEGAEPLAIAGMRRVLHDDGYPPIVLEFEPAFIERFGESPRALLDTLGELGYSLKVIDEKSGAVTPMSNDAIMERARAGGDMVNLVCVSR